MTGDLWLQGLVFRVHLDIPIDKGVSDTHPQLCSMTQPTPGASVCAPHDKSHDNIVDSVLSMQSC